MNATATATIKDGVCDFCTDPNIVWSYGCGPVAVMLQMDDEVLPGISTDEPWAACPTCAALIEADDRAGLLTRCADIMRLHHGLADRADINHVIRLSVQALHDGFWMAKRGPRTAVRRD